MLTLYMPLNLNCDGTNLINSGVCTVSTASSPDGTEYSHHMLHMCPKRDPKERATHLLPSGHGRHSCCHRNGLAAIGFATKAATKAPARLHMQMNYSIFWIRPSIRPVLKVLLDKMGLHFALLHHVRTPTPRRQGTLQRVSNTGAVLASDQTPHDALNSSPAPHHELVHGQPRCCGQCLVYQVCALAGAVHRQTAPFIGLGNG